MRLFSWLLPLQVSLKQIRARRPRQSTVQLERLEERTVPVCIDFTAGALTVALEPGEVEVSIHAAAGSDSPVVVTVDGVDHRGNGTDLDSRGAAFTANAEDVTSILVWAETVPEPITNCGGNTESNIIDLSDVPAGGFIGLEDPSGTNFVVTILGGDGDDTIIGSSGDALGDSIVGGAGNDSIDASGKDDSVSGGDGDDTIDGGDGFDTLNGDAGDDSLIGGLDADTLRGGDGEDTLEGGDGDDSLSGGFGDDELHGDEGDDCVAGDAGNDMAFGEAGNDSVTGGSDNDTVDGGDGCDTVRGDAGDDVL